MGDNDSEGNAIPENFLPFIKLAVHSEQTKEGEKEKRQREKKRRIARMQVKVLSKHTWRVKHWSRGGVTYDCLSQ